jgi:toxin HigB-1
MIQLKSLRQNFPRQHIAMLLDLLGKPIEGCISDSRIMKPVHASLIARLLRGDKALGRWNRPRCLTCIMVFVIYGVICSLIMASGVTLIRSFRDTGSEDIFEGRNSGEARKSCPSGLWGVARRKLDQLNVAVSLESLRVPPGNHLEALAGERKGQHSIRINQQYRVCFVWVADSPESVEIVDYH